MRFYHFFLVLNLTLMSSVFANDYISSVHTGSLRLQKSFESILIESYKHLPYTKKIIQSNQNYSLSMHNGRIDFNTSIEYTFNYAPKLPVKLSLVYSLEEIMYYKNYINHSKNTDTPVFELQNSALGSFLWNIDESTAYYVNSNNNTGILLKIQFTRNTTLNPTVETAINDIIQKTQWTPLQRLYN